VFFVKDDPACNFSANAYQMVLDSTSAPVLEPGLSFFDREDQQDLFKLHLPYIWRTRAETDVLFIPLVNRASCGLELQSGLVETDWYASPVNMILRKSANPTYIQAGDDIAHAIVLPRQSRNVSIDIAADHSRIARETRKALLAWQLQHAKDRSAYKLLAKGRERESE